MRFFILLPALGLFLAGCANAMPQSAVEDALADVDTKASNAGRYGQDQGAIDDSLLGDLFGTSGQSGTSSGHSGSNSGQSGSTSGQSSNSASTGSSHNINDGYQPPEKEKQVVNNDYAQCSGYADQGYKCVPYYQCDEYGEIIIDGGEGLIDIRGNFGTVNIELDAENSKCEGYLDVCCRHPDFFLPVTTSTPKPEPIKYQPRCGKHNSNGIGVRIQNYGEGGGDASTQFGEWPHMCAVLEKKDGKNLYVCGASLIAEGIVMTAAHCVDKKEYANLKIRCGEWDTQRQIEPSPHQDRDVEFMKVHPGYSGRNLTNDVALLFTYEPFVLHDHLDTICLPSTQDLRKSYDWDKCVATGWGKDEFGSEGVYQVILKQVEIGLWTNNECQDALRTTRLGANFNLDRTALCAGGRGKVDTCKGDGGGPLVCPSGESFVDSYGTTIPIYVQAGIVGWGVGCGQDGVPGVYTDVADMMCYIDWATRCVRGADYEPYGQDGCGRRWAVRQRNDVRRALRSWQGISDSILPRKSRTVDRKIKAHQVVLNKWNAEIDSCTNFPANLVDDTDDDPYGGEDDQPDLTEGGYQRVNSPVNPRVSSGDNDDDDHDDKAVERR